MAMVSKEDKLSIRQQCLLLGLCRTSLYYTPSEETPENLEIMRLLDRQYANIDVYTRYVVGWSVSNTMTAPWCVAVLQEAIERHGCPEIINSDQGSQFTSVEYVQLLEGNNIAISMDSRGRALDDIYIERLWRSVKQEYVYLNPCDTGDELWRGLNDYFRFYNEEGLHQSLGYRTPASFYTPHKEAA